MIKSILATILIHASFIGLPATDGLTSIVLAAAENELSQVKLFIELGVDVNTKDKSEWTALARASANGHGDIVDYLLKCPSVNINSLDWCGCTPLHRAAQSGYVDIVVSLLHAGAHDITDIWGQTPLYYAEFFSGPKGAEASCREIARILRGNWASSILVLDGAKLAR